MGCDIHFCVEKRVNGTWQRAEEKRPCPWDDDGRLEYEAWYADRNYALFGLLAGVRSDAIPPISKPRGVPEDSSIDPNADDRPVGEHSVSWLGLQELLDYDWSQMSMLFGVVDAETFCAWKAQSRWQPYDNYPTSYCAEIGGGGVMHVPQEEMVAKIDALKKLYPDDWRVRVPELLHNVYTTVEWPVMHSVAARGFYSITMPRLIALSRQVGGAENVRIVFGFDS